jgi:RND family efflux transporter MFP subunit
MNRRARQSRALGAATLFLGALWGPPALIWTGCGGESAPPDPVIRPVRTQTVFATGTARTRSFPGIAAAGIESSLSFKVAGTVDRLPVGVGDRVRSGQLIARIDPTDFDLQVENARAEVARREAESRKADANYERFRQLWETGNATPSDLDAARATSEAAAAGLESAEKNLALAESRLGYTRLLAPADGAIAGVEVEVNENVGAGQTVAVLASGDRPEVDVAVPGVLIEGIRERDGVAVTFDALPGRTFSGTVTEVGVAATRGGATFPVCVRLDEQTEAVRPGMAAEVAFRFGSAGEPERIYVPASAVLQDRVGRYSFVVEETEPGLGTVHRRPVEIGELQPQGLEIVDGLFDGERIVTAGVSRIRDGQTVRLPESSGTGP